MKDLAAALLFAVFMLAAFSGSVPRVFESGAGRHMVTEIRCLLHSR